MESDGRHTGSVGNRTGDLLAGVRVIDMCTSYAGPTATMYLADMGADVIKVEKPKNGDDARLWGPPFVASESAWFLSANRNKRSICIDVSTREGYRLLSGLLEEADVFVASSTPEKLARLRLSPSEVTRQFPRLIYCALSGWGLSGPDSNRPGYDLIAQARSGLMSVTGERGRMPQRVSTALSDIVAGLVAAFAVAAALRRKAQTGLGELIDVSLLDADLALMAPRIASYLAGAQEPRPSGGTDSVLSVYQPFQTADRPIVVAVGNDAMWERLCNALELAGLADDHRFSTNEGRLAHRSELMPLLEKKLLSASSAHWMARLSNYRIPCGTVQFLSEVVRDPQVQARKAICKIQHPSAGAVEMVTSPWRIGLENEGIEQHAPPPLLGQHTSEILMEIGYGPDQIKDLMEKGIVCVSATRFE